MIVTAPPYVVPFQYVHDEHCEPQLNDAGLLGDAYDDGTSSDSRIVSATASGSAKRVAFFKYPP